MLLWTRGRSCGLRFWMGMWVGIRRSLLGTYAMRAHLSMRLARCLRLLAYLLLLLTYRAI